MPERTQRRLAAIISADVVGYSRLIGVDEIRTLSDLRKHRAEFIDPKISEHNGRIVKTMGDGLLLEFASVVDATRCVIEIQRGMIERNASIDENQRIIFRIGVNLGDIVIEGEDILGDGVNVAARLQEIADPGGVSISRRVYEDVQNRLDEHFTDTGEQTLKNIARSVQVWNWSPTGKPTTPLRNAADSIGLPQPGRLSIAVLPFDNMSNDPDQGYFADGISEDIITDLSKISTLFVIARNSSFSYKGEVIDIQRVSRDLGVRYVVEGSVRKAGSRTRVTAQLIDAHSGGHIWADRYDRELSDIFAVQDEITSEIVSALQLVLRPDEAKMLARPPTSDFRAYDFYLKGRQCFNLMTKAKFIEARQWFERAIECDPKFARAYCGIADCGSRLHSEHGGDGNYMNGVIDAVTKALKCEPNLAEAHASMGLALSGSMGLMLAQAGERRTAEEEFAIAIELDPDLYEAHYYWARLCFEQGDLSAAADHFEEAWRVSPRDPKPPSLLIGIYRDLNRTDDLKIAARKTLDAAKRKLELVSADSQAYLACATALVHLDRNQEALSMVERAVELDPADRVVIYNSACVFATMGETDLALNNLEKMTGTGSQNLDWMDNDGDLDSLRDHPRFKQLMKRLRKPPEITAH